MISKKLFLNEAKLGTADLKLITRVMHAREKILKDFPLLICLDEETQKICKERRI